MKKRYLVLLIVIVTTMIPMGCSKESSKKEVLRTEKIIIDDNTKDKENGDFKTEMVAEIESLETGTIYCIEGVKENIIQLIYDYQNESDNIREVRVGKLDGNNKVNWTTQNVDWGIYTDFDYDGLYSIKLRKDNKVYNVNKDGELEELVGYTKLINEQGNVLNYDDSYRDGTIDAVSFGSEEEPELAVIDIPNEKYYVIPDELKSNDEYGTIRQILGIEGDKIYVKYLYSEEPGALVKNPKNTIGYIENNKFTKILSEDDGTKIDTWGEMLYENGRILFSGLAEGKNGIWNYDVNTKKLTKIVDVDSGTYFKFYINESKDKVIISSLKLPLEEGAKYNNTLSIANINDKLEITNITNIFTSAEDSYVKGFAGWSNGGKTFYVRSTIMDENYNRTNKLEVYNIVK